MSNPSKPHNLKVIQGTSRKDRDGPPAVDLPLVEGIPSPPEWLPNHHAVTEWRRLAPILHANRLLSTAALSTLAMLCALHGKIVQLLCAGETPTSAMVSQYRGLSNDFGLTP